MKNETKKDIIKDIIECINWIRENKNFQVTFAVEKKCGIDYTLYCSERLTESSLMKNKKENLNKFRYCLLEEIIYA